MVGNSALQAVIDGFGSQSALGRAIGIAQSTVWEWTRTGRVPIRHTEAVRHAAARLSPPVFVSRAELAGVHEDRPLDEDAA